MFVKVCIMLIVAYRILIDDSEKLAYNWIERGGIFIHHTSTKSTLKKLREEGVI